LIRKLSRRFAPRRGVGPLQGRSFWESSPPMGTSESPAVHRENQAAGRRKRLARRPRMRRGLLKGCEQRFHLRQARQRYCSERCREAARKWSRWQAQQRYRATRAGKQQRNGQSQRYRERVHSRKPPEPEAVDKAARAITTEHLFSTIPATGRAATRNSSRHAASPNGPAAALLSGLRLRPRPELSREAG